MLQQGIADNRYIIAKSHISYLHVIKKKKLAHYNQGLKNLIKLKIKIQNKLKN